MTTYAPGQFYQLPNNIARAVRSPYELAVLTYLIQCSDNEGKCFPGQDVIAQGSMSIKQVNRATAKLSEDGVVKIDREWLRGGGIRLSYTVQMDRLISLVQQTHSPISNRLPVRCPTD